VCALPSSDLQTIAVDAPRACDSTAARSPAPPAPMMRTSNSWVSYSPINSPPGGYRSAAAADLRGPSGLAHEPPGPPSEQPRVGDRPARNHPNVQVGQRYAEQRRPRPPRVVDVQPRHPPPQRVPHLVLRELVQPTADEVPARMARQRVPPQQEHVH